MKRNGSMFLTITVLAAFSAGGLLMAQESAVHVSQAEAMKAAKEKPAPEYPPMAKQLHLEGEVQVQAHGQHVFRLEPRIDVQQVAEAAQHQSRADQQ